MFRPRRLTCKSRCQSKRCCVSRIHQFDPDVFRIFWVERDRTDRLHRLFIKHGSVSRPAIIRFPDAATRCADKKRDLADGSRVPAMAETRPLIVAEPMLRAPRPEMVAELNGASSAPQEIMQRSSNESDAEDTPKSVAHKGRVFGWPWVA